MNRIIISIFCLFIVFNAAAQEKEKSDKKYQVALIGFYNLENLYDTINDPGKNDEEFLPDGSNRYTGAVYLDKLGKLSEVISLIGSDITPDGLAIMTAHTRETRRRRLALSLRIRVLHPGRNISVPVT